MLQHYHVGLLAKPPKNFEKVLHFVIEKITYFSRLEDINNHKIMTLKTFETPCKTG